MAPSLDRHTLVDLTVNAVPLCILALFGLLFVVYNPWGRIGLAPLLQFGLLLVFAASLAYLSYRSGLAISRSAGESGESPGGPK